MNDLPERLQRSRVAAVWRVLWHLFPKFAAKRSPIYFFSDGAVLWSQGFGRVAYVSGKRSLYVGWGIGAANNERRILLSQVRRWNPPYGAELLTPEELHSLRDRLAQKYQAQGEKVSFQ